MVVETLKTEGAVKAVKLRETGWAIKIDNEWYGYFGNIVTAPNKGDNVEIEFVITGKWKNLTKIEILGTTKATPEKASEKLTSCLTSYAKDLACAKPDLTMEDANKFIWDAYEFFKEKLE